MEEAEEAEETEQETRKEAEKGGARWNIHDGSFSRCACINNIFPENKFKQRSLKNVKIHWLETTKIIGADWFIISVEFASMHFIVFFILKK